MSSLTTSLGVLAFVAIGVAGWQASRPEPTGSLQIEIPQDPIVAVALPGLPELPSRLLSEPAAANLVLPPELGTNGLPCGVRVTTEVFEPATVSMVLGDACEPFADYELHHAGLTLAVQADAQGNARVDLPAMERPARIEIVRDGGIVHAGTHDIPDLDDYVRAAITWNGGAGLGLHAHEFGANTGDRGHIHPGATGEPRDALLGTGGYLTVLGPDGGPAAQIYTFPQDTSVDGGLVRLSVTADCGQTVSATRHQTQASGTVRQAELQITTPDCGSEHEQSRLQNLFQDLRIARR